MRFLTRTPCARFFIPTNPILDLTNFICILYLHAKMQFLTCIIFVFLAACGPQPKQEPARVDYKITPENNGFLVEISHDGTGQITQIVPPHDSYQEYRTLTATQDHPIRYFIVPKPRDPRVSDTFIDLHNGYFQTVGHGFLVCIGQDINQKKSIRMTWNAPNHWQFASSFKEQKFEASCNHLRKALYVGGHNLKIQPTWFGTLAVTGSFTNLTISDIENALKQNMEQVRSFWNDAKPEPHYFVSIRGTDSKKHGGTAQFQSFQLDLARDQMKDHKLDRLITHEYFHHWNGLKINQVPSNDPTAHLDIWWFIEGFTDYFAYKLTSPADLLSNMCFKNVSLFELKRNYGNNHTYYDIPYIQGRKIALLFDSAISTHSDKRFSLKNVMHEIIKRSENPSFLLTQNNFLKVICEGNYMPCSTARNLLQSYVIAGTQLPF